MAPVVDVLNQVVPRLETHRAEPEHNRRRCRALVMRSTKAVGVILVVIATWIIITVQTLAADPQAKVLPEEILTQPPLRNSIGMELKLIPAGTFLMGSANGDSDEQPVHEVTISRPYYLGVTEVTNGQWQAVMGDVPSKWKNADLPVESVIWDDAVAFCKALSALPAERQAGRVYRLPTEAEWEYACRAGTSTKYSFGDDESLLGDFAWYSGNSGRQTHPVGQRRPNAWGLYDMHGNVWEWCSDWYGDYTAGAVRDPVGPASGSYRVLRGGSWYSAAWYCRSADRGRPFPSIRCSNDGFRLALSPSGASSPEAGE
jgi:formylglycine-generating enzyme required for sulfatase activity